MFHQPTLPTLDEAIAAIAQEEVRLKVMKSNVSPPSRPAFIVNEYKETRDCFNYGEKGHLSHDCRAPPKLFRGQGRGAYRGGTRGSRGRGYRGDYKANVATQGGGTSNNVDFSIEELEELRKLKKKMENTDNKAQEDTTFGDFAHFTYANEGKSNWEEAWDRHQA